MTDQQKQACDLWLFANELHLPPALRARQVNDPPPDNWRTLWRRLGFVLDFPGRATA